LLILRLTRTGRRNEAHYRLAAVDSRNKLTGAALELLGHYDPKTEVAKIVFKEESIYAWLKKGAQPTETVRSLLKKMGIWKKWLLMAEGKDVSSVAVERKPETKKRPKRNRHAKKEAAA